MLAALETRFDHLFRFTGGIVLLLLRSLAQVRFAGRDLRRILEQMASVGYRTMPLASLIGMFTGMTLALNTGFVFSQYSQEEQIAAIVALSLMREMGPVITAVIIVGRVGAAMTAELGTMSVNDEINVLRVLGIPPERYLVMPRVIASILMSPVLTIYAIIVGLIGGAVVSGEYFNVSYLTYRTVVYDYLDWEDIWKGLIKTFVFGAVYSAVCCYLGIQTRGGAEGVGRATTSAVVISLSSVLVANYLLTRFLFG